MVNIERIKSLAKEKGLSLSFICSKIGVARIYFNDIQKYNREIPVARLQVIADLLGTTVEYLNGKTNEKGKPAANDRQLPDVLYRVLDLSDEKQKEIFAFIEFKEMQQKNEQS